jgi:hypothetical protein
MVRSLVLIVLLISVGHVLAQDAEVLDLSRRKFNWMIYRQLDSLDAFLDEQALYIHSNGWVQNRKEIIDDFKSGKLKLDSVSTEEASVRLFSNAAIVTGRGTFSGMISGTPFHSRLLFTEVYIRKQTGWKLVSRHACRMP